ncbi:MAG: type II toxin-antitoxin system HicB family antitoxin [Nitrospinae bacterium]|nr:type II toxin-antitoxin system HicB family antitoxin [Nitrospinota bacterium]
MNRMKRKILRYSAVFDPAQEGGFNVSFPDFPGCVTFGRSFEDAKENAREVLELWLTELAAGGEKIPVFDHRPIIDDVEISLPANVRLSHAANHR